MILNGIDYDARRAALSDAGIDPYGEMVQFKTVLGAAYVYCRQHHGVHRTVASCAVHAIEQFPLRTTGDFEDAFTECRERGFRLYGEPRPCLGCGEEIALGSNGWGTTDEGDRICSAPAAGSRSNAHLPAANIPQDASSTV